MVIATSAGRKQRERESFAARVGSLAVEPKKFRPLGRLSPHVADYSFCSQERER